MCQGFMQLSTFTICILVIRGVEIYVLTPGDNPDVLVAMNPAALKAHLHDLAPNGMLILNEDAFEEKNITKAGYKVDPRESGELDGYRVFQVPMEKLTKEALEEFDLPGRAVLRSKNMVALGLISWTFNRPLEDTENWINDKFSKLPEIAKANIKALKTGYNFGITVEAFHHTYVVEKAALPAGEYTNINGNICLSWGLIAAAKKANLDLFYGSYPITPASDILHELSKHKNFNVITFQAEDEIAAAAASVVGSRHHLSPSTAKGAPFRCLLTSAKKRTPPTVSVWLCL